MPDNKDRANEQNIAEVLEMLKQSYGEEKNTADVDELVNESNGAISEDELKEKLRMHFPTEDEIESDYEKDSYHIDEDFFRDAEPVEAPEETIEEVLEEEIEQTVDEPEGFDAAPWDDTENITEDAVAEIEQAEDAVGTEEIEEPEGFEEIEEPKSIVDQEAFSKDEVDYDDDITFDELETIEEEDDIPLMKLELDDELEFASNDVTFDDLEQFETPKDTFVLTKLDLDEEPTAKLKTVLLEEQYIVELPREELELEETVVEEEVAEEKIKAESNEAEEDFLSEFFANEPESVSNVEGQVVLDAFDAGTDTLDSADMSLLMQFGCDTDDLNKYASDNEIFSKEEKNTEYTEEQKQERLAKIFAKHDKYIQKRGNVFFRMLISGIFALVLLFYDFLPIFGVEFPGILNSQDYFIPYLLLGFQFAALCLVPSYKQIWKGAQRLFSRSPDAYSIVVAVAGTVLLYDFTLLFVNDGSNPPMFHFAMSCIMMFALTLELQNISMEKRCFESFFFDELNQSEKQTTKFTLCKSEGKNSVAQKMYDGGVARYKNIYTSLEIEQTDSVLTAFKKRSRRREIPMKAFIPSLAFSLVMWLTTLIIYGQIWIAFCSMITTMLLTLPIVGVFCSFLPFERFSAKGKAMGYAFASQAAMEEYSNSDVLTFKDTHLFSTVDASSVNMVFYDATAKDVLMGCLDAVYSTIGGPMGNTFSRGEKKRFDKCRITRIAKNGVEAVVENNYSVLIGTEQFMARYGISFPNVSLNRDDDKIFTLCISINGRVTARLAVRYSVNEMFYMFSKRLWEDGISCAIETFDPMVSSELVARVMPKKQAPISIIHLNVNNFEEKGRKGRDKFLFDVEDKELDVISLTSRLNFAVALCDAKRIRKMVKQTNLLSIGVCALGAVLAFLFAFFKISEHINALYILLYWIVGIGGFVGLVLGTFPKISRFSYEDFKAEQELNAVPKTQTGKN